MNTGLDVKIIQSSLRILTSESVPIVNDTVADQDIVIFLMPDTDSGFNAFNSTEARVIGSTAVYNPNLNDQKLTFKIESGNIVDEQSGSI